MKLSFLIGKRYAMASQGKSLVFSIASVLGIAIGIIALIVTLAVMNGVTTEVRDKILSMTAHAKILSTTGDLLPDTDISPFIKGEEGVLAEAMFIEGQGLLGVGRSYDGVRIKGIVPSEEPKVSDALMPISEDLKTLKAGQFNVAIGQELANKYGISLGDKVTLVVPEVSMSAAGMLPRVKRFTVTAFFNSGHYLYDTTLVLTNINDAARLLRRGNYIDGFQLKLDDLFKAQGLVDRINKKLPSSLIAYDWTMQNKAYFDAVKIEKAALFFILLMILLVAAFNIFSTLTVVVSDKKKDIAILRTLGVPPMTIMRTFMIQGVSLCLIGTIVGVLGGVFIASQVPGLLALAESKFGFKLPAELYFISELHPRIDFSLVALIAGSALAMSFVAAAIPAFVASRLQPARALAYE